MHILGLMSGTSLDGLDIAYCDIRDDGFTLLAAETIPYPTPWVERLSTLESSSAYQYCLANVELGHYIGQQVNRFREEHPGPVDAIASHGHTIFHQPGNRVATEGSNLVPGLTTQIGDGDAIAAETGLPVIFNFRTMDVALGGQGAPLVPIGDELIFGQYDACLNLGGIANISFRARREGKMVRQAFDICPCNMALNHLARLDGREYDRNGILARSGTLLESLLDRMDSLDYYRQPLPKTLGKEWFTDNLLPLLQCQHKHLPDMMRTTVEHIASQIAWAIRGRDIRSMLVTGGGAKNKFLIARLQAQIPSCHIYVPAEEIVDYKEAIIFALLGYLRLKGRNNCLASVTGASRDNCGGNIAGL